MSALPWIAARPGRLDAATVWRVGVAEAASGLDRLNTLLSPDERARAERFLRAEDRARYVVGHAALRMILAAALGAEPAALVFAADEGGKPALGGPWRDALSFNLSHSGDLALVALAPTARIGVDVEAVRALPDCLPIARAHFSREEVFALSRLAGTALRDAFFACWTRKEAFVKAVGLGLAMRLDRFSVAVPPQPPAVLSIEGNRGAGARWSLIHLDPAPDHVGALAIEAPGIVPLLRTLPLPAMSAWC